MSEARGILIIAELERQMVDLQILIDDYKRDERSHEDFDIAFKFFRMAIADLQDDWVNVNQLRDRLEQMDAKYLGKKERREQGGTNEC